MNTAGFEACMKNISGKTVSVPFAQGNVDSPDAHSERGKGGENRDKRMPEKVGTHAQQD